MSLRALLFDVDGTLADTESQGHLPAYNKAFKDFGLDWNWARALYRKLLLISGGRERIDHYLDSYRPELGEHRARVADDRQAWINDLHQRKAHHFRKRLEEGEVPLREGVARLIREAADAGLKIAIVTNASRATLEPFLQYALGAELFAHVAVCVCGDEVEHKKPAPDAYRMACQRLGCAPGDCMAIEDSDAGVSAADAAGVPVLVTVNADTRDQAFTPARAVVDSLGEPDVASQILKSPGFDFHHVDLGVLERLHAGPGRDARRSAG